MMSMERGSRLAECTVEDVRNSVARVLGEEFEVTWRSVCAAVPTQPDVEYLDDEAFARLLDALAGHDSLSRVVAMSWKIRRTAARKLAALGR